VHAEIDFNGNSPAKISAVFKLAGTDATLTNLDEAYIDGAHLIIPAQFDVAVPGYYRIQANLYDSASQQPISHLNSAFLLTKRENSGLLKVHAVTLRSQGSPGPYQLRDINVTRGPEKPGDKTGYGFSKQSSYEVNGFDLSHYSDEEFVDPKNQQRLEFLQKMAGL